MDAVGIEARMKFLVTSVIIEAVDIFLESKARVTVTTRKAVRIRGVVLQVPAFAM